MMSSRRSRVDSAFALVALVVMGAVVGCGSSDSNRSGGPVMGKADAVEVTYYYLPG